jgi:hypothetical protein
MATVTLTSLTNGLQAIKNTLETIQLDASATSSSARADSLDARRLSPRTIIVAVLVDKSRSLASSSITSHNHACPGNCKT